MVGEKGPETDPPFNNADFQSIFARSDSAVTPREKKSINTNRKFTTLSNEPNMNSVRCL